MEMLPGVDWVEGLNANPYLLTRVDGKIVVVDTGPSEQFSVDIREARRSIERLTILDFDIMLSGHGEPLRQNASALVREFYDSLKSY